MAEFGGPFICPALHRLGMLLRAAYILRNRCLADNKDIKAIGKSELNLRRMRNLITGGRSAVLRVKRERSPFGPWLDSLERRSPVKIVIKAAANKLARIAWAVLSSGDEYRSPTALTIG
jgi:hypothetical protein